MEHVLPSKNQPALAGYYCAIFSIVPIAGLYLGPAAICYGLIGMDRGNRLPHYIGYGHALFATVGGIIGSIINYGLVLVVSLILVNNYVQGHWPFLHQHQPVPGQEQRQDNAPGKNLL